MISQLVGMAVFGPVMSRSSKKMAILIGGPIRLAGILGLLAFSHEGAPLIPILALTALVGFGNAGSLTGIFAVMADMTDVDELITSIRRPGIVSSMATFVRKISSGFSAAAIGFLLAAVGYDEVLASSGARQAAATQRGIGLIFILAPAILTVLLIVVDLFFPITGKEFRLVQEEIARRKGSEPGEATQEERETLEKITGFDYDRLWNVENAGLKKH
jgi:oligogalacturonide transporter